MYTDLIWRLEDLQSRLEELEEEGAPVNSEDEWRRLSEDDIRYAIPEYFDNITDVERAIALVKSDLQVKLGINSVFTGEEAEKDIPLAGQLYFDETEFIAVCKNPLMVA